MRRAGGRRGAGGGRRGAGRGGWTRGRPGRSGGDRTHEDVQGEHSQEQPGQHDGRGARPPPPHEAPPVARPVSRAAGTLMPSRRKADATRARSSRPTSNCAPGSVRATIRTENVSTSILSTPITVGGSSIILRNRSSL